MDQPDALVQLADRVRSLERQNRRFALGLGAIAALAAAVILLGAARPPQQPKALVAESFILTDSMGELRGAFSVLPDGGASLVLYGPDGKVTTRLPFTTEALPLSH